MSSRRGQAFAVLVPDWNRRQVGQSDGRFVMRPAPVAVPVTAVFVPSGLFDAIAKRLAIHRRIRVVELGSLGGLTYEGLKIGRLLRQRNIVTVVANNCYSSCALIFLGGKHRIVPAPYWSLGFHRASSDGTPLWDGDEVYEKIRVYVDEMIGDGPGLVNSSLTPIGLDFYRPSRQEMCDREIATSVEGVCGENTSSVIGSTLE